MKNSLLLCALIGIMFSFALSCSKVNDKEIVVDHENEIIKDKLGCIGYDTKVIKMLDNNIVQVYDDLLIDKSIIFNTPTNTNSVQLRNYVVNSIGIADYTKVSNILYWIDPAIIANTPQWEAAIVEATNNWSSIPGSNIRYTRVAQLPLLSSDPLTIFSITNSTSNGGTLIPEGCKTRPVGEFAFAYYPSANSPGGLNVGRMVILNANQTTCINGTQLNASARATIMRHEIGHTLGFRHTPNPGDLSFTQCNGNVVNGINWLCTSTDNQSSIMKNPINCNEVINFSQNDFKGINMLYPQNNADVYINFLSHNYNTGKIQFNIKSSSSWNNIEITKHNGFKTNVCAGDACCEGVQFWEIDNGFPPYNIHLKLSNFKGDYSIERDFSVNWW